MSNQVFPSLPGFDIKVSRMPVYATLIQAAPSGKELRASFQSSPRFRYTLVLNFVRQAGFSAKTAYDEAATLMQFFADHRGAWDSFLFTDPYENHLTAKQFGTGNGTTTAFQLVDGVGNPITELNGAPAIYRADWQGNQLLYSTARTNLVTYSGQADNANWAKTAATVVANTSASPDGVGSLMDALVEDTSTGLHGMRQGFVFTPGQTYTFSVFVRPNGRTKCSLVIDEGGGNYHQAFFDVPNLLVTGHIAGGSSVIMDATVVAIGGGAFKVSLSGVAPAGSGVGLYEFRLCDASGSQSYTGTGLDMHVWGMDFKAGVLSSYIGPTTTAAITVTDYAISSTGLVTCASAPLSGAVLTWTGSYYRRVRFDGDELELERMLSGAWDGKTVKLISIK